NISYSNQLGDIVNNGSGGETFATNLCSAKCTYNGNPNFLNAAANDFHLTASSTLAVDHGTTLTAVSSDFDGVLRPQGGAYDIGAYQYTSSPAAPSNLRVVTSN